MFSTAGKGLEIGPSHSPLMPKAAGFDVEILDHLDANGLRRKYADAGVDVSAIEDVDYIGDGRPMTEVIGSTHCYDWIVASHVVEHVPDLVAFLVDCEALLKPGGSLVVAVPDKRCCFDILRPVSTVGQVLQAHVDRRLRPWPGVIFDDVAYARKRGDRIGWTLGDQEPLEQVRSPEEAWQVFRQACDADTYVDMHCWVFVPSSFRLIINSLSSFGLITLNELDFQASDGEFYSVLSTLALQSSTNFGPLAQTTCVEERMTSALALGGQAQAGDSETIQLRQDLASARAALAAALDRAAALTRRLSKLTASPSWRLTAPIRAVEELVRRQRTARKQDC